MSTPLKSHNQENHQPNSIIQYEQHKICVVEHNHIKHKAQHIEHRRHSTNENEECQAPERNVRLASALDKCYMLSRSRTYAVNSYSARLSIINASEESIEDIKSKCFNQLHIYKIEKVERIGSLPYISKRKPTKKSSQVGFKGGKVKIKKHILPISKYACNIAEVKVCKFPNVNKK